MAERLPITSDEITPHLHETSLGYHFMEIQRRREEEKIPWFVASAGMLVSEPVPRFDEIMHTDKRFVSSSKLVGLERRLNYKTLVAVRSLTLPVDMSDSGIDAFFEDHQRTPEQVRKIGFVGINEPGVPIFKPIKTEMSGCVSSDASGVDLAAEGLSHYLNNSEGIHTLEESVEEMSHDITRTYGRLDVYKERMHNKFIKLMQGRGGERPR